MGKRSFLVYKNSKSQRTILHDPGCAFPKMPINQGQEVINKFYSMFAEFFKELYRVHACLEVATTQQREEWTHQPHSAAITDTEYSDSDNKESVMPP